MKRFLYCPLTVVLLFLSSNVQAQTVSKVEVQAQFTSLTVARPDQSDNSTEAGFGGRVVFNFNEHFALEGEGNYFPNKSGFELFGGNAVQGQFGVKAGKRFGKYGVFLKARPGFLSIADVSFVDATSDASGTLRPTFHTGRKTRLTLDLGGVLEFYPSKKTIVRFDAGETFVREGSRFDIDPTDSSLAVRLPARTTNKLQLSAAVGFRLGTPQSPTDVVDSGTGKDPLPKFEVGIQFTSLSLNPRTSVCALLCFIPEDRGPVTDLGLGGRVTYNLTRNLAVEAEGNFFTHEHENFRSGPSGHIYQGQFGAKIGKRFEHFGVFGKVRPGFVGFTQVFQLAATHTGVFFGRPFTFGEFRLGHKEYFSTDVGGVLEFYVSRRVMTRMDFGDTIIHYSESQTEGFSVSQAIVRKPPETRHNFQFNAGVGFRF